MKSVQSWWFSCSVSIRKLATRLSSPRKFFATRPPWARKNRRYLMHSVKNIARYRVFKGAKIWHSPKNLFSGRFTQGIRKFFFESILSKIDFYCIFVPIFWKLAKKFLKRRFRPRKFSIVPLAPDETFCNQTPWEKGQKWEGRKIVTSPWYRVWWNKFEYDEKSQVVKGSSSCKIFMLRHGHRYLLCFLEETL